MTVGKQAAGEADLFLQRSKAKLTAGSDIHSIDVETQCDGPPFDPHPMVPASAVANQSGRDNQ